MALSFSQRRTRTESFSDSQHFACTDGKPLKAFSAARANGERLKLAALLQRASRSQSRALDYLIGGAK